MIVYNPYIANVVKRHGGYDPYIVPIGINLQRFSPAPLNPGEKDRLIQKYNLSPTRKVILHVGRLDTDKQVHIVIQAAAKAIRNSNAQLLVVGDGQQRERLVRITETCGVREHCHFPGFVDQNGDLPRLYQMSTVFTTASEIETQGLVILEAMASGLPVVAARATCIPDVVHDGVNGFLVDPQNIEAMAERLVDVISNPGLSAQMGMASLRWVRSYDQASVVEGYETLYRRLIVENSLRRTSDRPQKSRLYLRRRAADQTDGLRHQ
jgi:glycosyltransferase involved in cell wall biosynthesis